MINKSILIVDDEQELREQLSDILLRSGYTEVQTAGDAQQAMALMQQKMPGLVVLDVMMPGTNGFELLQEIRKVSKVPVIMLTAKGEAEDKFAGFAGGADDYLVKPFLPKELLFRIQAVLKRVYPEDSREVSIPVGIINLDRAEVITDQGCKNLTAKEYAIFVKLYENAGRIVTMGSLCQTAVGEIWEGYENTLMTHIRHLREKIERDPSHPEVLITVRGLGYKLNL